ncbi:hypothetical protein CF327_g5739 [Tilletia walkeri]|uniref:F-box domain-containing protein n=1 Tax=Tilletia walkeri TaxID=117179 RepID=A0A8X7N8R5_9BASI|nr:hypothetical protein CF327_g5739 [Tilletia walkeri]KAE8267705.1 hypothetical protein A4X09_0g4650 [Tilletia walkeri]
MSFDILAALPPELAIEIFAFLDPGSLTRCTAVSKAWRNAIANDLIWRRVATEQLCLCPDETEVQDLAALPSLKRWSASGHLAGLANFRQLCVRWQQVLVGWRGRRGLIEDQQGLDQSEPEPPEGTAAIRHPSLTGVSKIQATSDTIGVMAPEGQLDIWRIKLDPEDRTLIATTRTGGLHVVDIETNQIVWQLGSHQIGSYKHLEGERGVLVMNRRGPDGEECFEVWVHRRLIPDEGNGELYQSRSIILTSQGVRASRFKWPIFCGMGELGTAFFWDLTDPDQPRQLNSIDASARHSHAREINYVDFDDQHLFLVGQYLDQVTIYDRTTGQVKWSMAAYLRQADAASLVRSYKMDFDDLIAQPTDPRLSTFDFFERKLLPKEIDPQLKEKIERGGAVAVGDGRFEWVAIHPDEATGALFILGRLMLVIVPNFASLSESSCRVPIMAIEYRTWGFHQSTFPMFSDVVHQLPLTVADGRALFVEANNILVDLAPQRQVPLTPGSAPFLLPVDPDVLPPLRVFASHNPFFDLADRIGIHGCSCAQMDAANIFTVFQTEAPDYEDTEDEADMREAICEVLHWHVDADA